MAQTLAQLKANAKTVYYELVKIETSTVYNVTNAPFNITYDSTEYESIGALMALDQLESNMSFEVPKITLSINGLMDEDDDGNYFIEEMLGLEYVDRPVTIYRTYFDLEQHSGSYDPTNFTIEVFKGFIDNAGLQYDPSGGCSVAIEISSHWVTFDKTNGRFTNQKSQQYYYPSDTGLNNCDEVQKEIIWKP